MVFKKSLCSCALGESSLSIGRVKFKLLPHEGVIGTLRLPGSKVIFIPVHIFKTFKVAKQLFCISLENTCI